MERVRVICPVCGKEVGGYIPRGGNGSGFRVRRHLDLAKQYPCEGGLSAIVSDRNHIIYEYDCKECTNGKD